MTELLNQYVEVTQGRRKCAFGRVTHVGVEGVKIVSDDGAVWYELKSHIKALTLPELFKLQGKPANYGSAEWFEEVEDRVFDEFFGPEPSERAKKYLAL